MDAARYETSSSRREDVRVRVDGSAIALALRLSVQHMVVLNNECGTNGKSDQSRPARKVAQTLISGRSRHRLKGIDPQHFLSG